MYTLSQVVFCSSSVSQSPLAVCVTWGLFHHVPSSWSSRYPGAHPLHQGPQRWRYTYLNLGHFWVCQKGWLQAPPGDEKGRGSNRAHPAEQSLPAVLENPTSEAISVRPPLKEAAVLMAVICTPGLLFLCLHCFSFTNLKPQFILPLLFTTWSSLPEMYTYIPDSAWWHVHNATHEKAFMILNFILLNNFFTAPFKIYILNIPTKASRLKRETP